MGLESLKKAKPGALERAKNFLDPSRASRKKDWEGNQSLELGEGEGSSEGENLEHLLTILGTIKQDKVDIPSQSLLEGAATSREKWAEGR